MSYENSLSSLLVDELKNLGLLPSFYEFTIVNNSVISKGREKLASFRKVIGNFTWWKGFATTRQWYFNYSGVAGWGYYLSSYINAPLKLSPSENEIVGHIGALSSLIVTLYDSFLDNRVSQYPPIRLQRLNDILQNDPAIRTIEQQKASGSIILLSRLIELFLADICKLPYIKHRSKIFSLLKKSVIKMYEAENETVMCHPQDISKYILIRKSAYPFIIMGLTGWLASSYFDQSLYCWHLHWLYNIGSFFSLIDDAVDIHHDKLKGHPNLFIHHVKVDSINQFSLAKKIALKGMLLHYDWQQRVFPDNKLPFNVPMILASCLASWLM